MVNRKEEQGEEAIKAIQKEKGDDPQIEWIPCDMGNLKQVQETFSAMAKREERLDLVYISYHSTTVCKDHHPSHSLIRVTPACAFCWNQCR